MIVTSITILIAGIAATAAMTFMVNGAGIGLMKKFRLARLLGTMVSGETSKNHGLSKSRLSYASGLILHYLIGLVFSLLYYHFIVNQNRQSLTNAVIFGLLAGGIAIIAWTSFFYFHRNPPHINLQRFCLLLFSGHILFAIVLYFVYETAFYTH